MAIDPITLSLMLAQAALGGHLKVPKPDNFSNAFEGTTASGYGIVNALYNVIWSYIGYSNINYAMSEVRNPVRTLKRAGPTSLILVSILYMLVNVSQIEKLIHSHNLLTLQTDRILCSRLQGRDCRFRSDPCSSVLPQRLRRPSGTSAFCLRSSVSLWKCLKCYFLPRKT